MAPGDPNCPLCRDDGGLLVARAERWRVVRVEDADFPAFYRVIWNAHVAELSDLPPAHRHELMDVVCTVEQVLRAQLQPTKINLASLGNVVPHLHWHVIARFDWDSRFPQPIWAAAERAVEPPARARLALLLGGPGGLDGLDRRVGDALRNRSWQGAGGSSIIPPVRGG